MGMLMDNYPTPNELDDVLHAVNKYLEEVANTGEAKDDGLAATRLKAAIEKVYGIMPYPVMLDGKPMNGTEMVALALSHVFVAGAVNRAKCGLDPLVGLKEHIMSALSIGTMMGYEIGVAFRPPLSGEN
jgi:hypothetical protein